MPQRHLSGIAAASRPPNAGAVDVQKHLRALALGLVPLLPATKGDDEFTISVSDFTKTFVYFDHETRVIYGF